jgi:hypothetical protein
VMERNREQPHLSRITLSPMVGKEGRDLKLSFSIYTKSLVTILLLFLQILSLIKK